MTFFMENKSTTHIVGLHMIILKRQEKLVLAELVRKVQKLANRSRMILALKVRMSRIYQWTPCTGWYGEYTIRDHQLHHSTKKHNALGDQWTTGTSATSVEAKDQQSCA